MRQEMPGLYTTLALAGTLPFVAGAYCLSMGYIIVPVFGATALAVSLYALIILSFMAGTHWGMFFIAPHKRRVWLLLWSNFAALAGWFFFLFSAPLVFLCTLIALFFALLAVDFALKNDEIISNTYLRTRLIATFITVICLGVVALNI